MCRSDNPVDMVETCHWHKIHTDCLLELLQSIILQPSCEGRPRFICQGKGCQQPLKSEAVALALREAQGDLAERLDVYRTKFTIISNLQPLQELAFCPTLDCGAYFVVEEGVFSVVCHKCKKLFCPHCCRRTHFGHPCIPIRYKLCRDCCVYCKQRQAVREGCSRVVCHSEFCQGERAYCTVCRVGLPLEQESCRKCHPPDAEPLLPVRNFRQSHPALSPSLTPSKPLKYIIKSGPDITTYRKPASRPVRRKRTIPFSLEETKLPPSP